MLGEDSLAVSVRMAARQARKQMKDLADETEDVGDSFKQTGLSSEFLQEEVSLTKRDTQRLRSSFQKLDRQLVKTDPAVQKVAESVEEAGRKNEGASIKAEHFQETLEKVKDDSLDTLAPLLGVSESLEEVEKEAEKAAESTEDLTKVQALNNKTVKVSQKDLSKLEKSISDLSEETIEANPIFRSIKQEIQDASEEGREAAFDFYTLQKGISTVKNESLALPAAFQATESELDDLEEEAREAKQEFYGAAAGMGALSASSLSVNLGPLNIGLSKMLITVPILIGLLGTLTSVIAGLGIAAGGVLGGAGLILGGGLLALGDQIAQANSDIENAQDGVSEVMKAFGEALKWAMEPLMSSEMGNVAIDVLAAIAVAFRMVTETVASMQGTFLELFDAVGKGFFEEWPNIIDSVKYAVTELTPMLAAFTGFLWKNIPDAIRFFVGAVKEFGPTLAVFLKSVLRFTVALTDLAMTVLDFLLPVLGIVLEAITAVVRVFNSLPDEIESSIVTFLAFGGVLSAIAGKLSGAGGLTALIGMLAEKLYLLAKAAYMNPLVIFLSMFAAAISYFELWDELLWGIQKLVDGLSESLDYLNDKLGPILNMSKPVTDGLMAAIGVFGALGAVIYGVIAIMSGFGAAAGAVQTAVGSAGLAGSIGVLVSSLWPLLLVFGLVAGAFAAYQANFLGFKDFVHDMIPIVRDFIEVLEALFSLDSNKIGDKIEELGQHFGDFGELLIPIARTLESIVDSINWIREVEKDPIESIKDAANEAGGGTIFEDADDGPASDDQNYRDTRQRGLFDSSGIIPEDLFAIPPKNAFQKITTPRTGFLKAWENRINQGSKGSLDDVKQGSKTRIRGLGRSLRDLGRGAWENKGSAWERIKSTSGSAFKRIKSTARTASTPLRSSVKLGWKGLKKTGKGIGSKTWNTGSWIRGGLRGIKNNGLRSTLKGGLKSGLNSARGGTAGALLTVGEIFSEPIGQTLRNDKGPIGSLAESMQSSGWQSDEHGKFFEDRSTGEKIYKGTEGGLLNEGKGVLSSDYYYTIEDGEKKRISDDRDINPPPSEIGLGGGVLENALGGARDALSSGATSLGNLLKPDDEGGNVLNIGGGVIDKYSPNIGGGLLSDVGQELKGAGDTVRDADKGLFSTVGGAEDLLPDLGPGTGPDTQSQDTIAGTASTEAEGGDGGDGGIFSFDLPNILGGGEKEKQLPQLPGRQSALEQSKAYIGTLFAQVGRMVVTAQNVLNLPQNRSGFGFTPMTQKIRQSLSESNSAASQSVSAARDRFPKTQTQSGGNQGDQGTSLHSSSSRVPRNGDTNVTRTKKSQSSQDQTILQIENIDARGSDLSESQYRTIIREELEKLLGERRDRETGTGAVGG